MSTLPEGTELRVSGAAYKTKWSPKTYNVVAHIPTGPGLVGMKMVGYVHRAEFEDKRDKAWIVRDLQGEIIVSRAPLQNETREWALWKAEQSERWPDDENVKEI